MRAREATAAERVALTARECNRLAAEEFKAATRHATNIRLPLCVEAMP